MEQRLPIPEPLRASLGPCQAEVAWSAFPGRTTWRLVAPDGAVRYLKLLSLGMEPPLAAERARMSWAQGRLPVPDILAYGSDGETEWLLTTGLPGTAATDARPRVAPRDLVPILAQGLRHLHALPWAECPFDGRAASLLAMVRQRVALGLVDPATDFHSEHRRWRAAEALAELGRLRPWREDLVVCHGDFCLPNALIGDTRVSGLVDLGQLGVADRWRDLAIATWSVTWNLGPGWESLFLEAYGVRPAPRKQAFYRLIYDLLP